MAFSQKTLDFLFENRIHDSREWFQEHKDIYQKELILPFKQLVADLSPTVLEIDSEFVTEPRVGKTIARVWRDTRFSKDPALYRDNLWLTFRRGGKTDGAEYPGLYFGISPDGFSYGGGFYHASTKYMETMRELILEGDPKFQKASRAYRSQSIFQMEGECYKKPHFSDQPKASQEWLERRGISFNAHSHDMELLFSAKLADKLMEDFKLLAPIYQFLLHTGQRELQRKTELELAQR